MNRLVTLALVVFCGMTVAAEGEHEWSLARATGFIGFLRLPTIFEDNCTGRATPLRLFATPDSLELVAKIEPHKRASDGVCYYPAPQVSKAGDPATVSLPILEYDQDLPGALVVSRKGSWFEVRLATGSAWLLVNDPTTFIPVEKVLKTHTAYLLPSAEPFIHKQPALAGAIRQTNGKLPIKVLATTTREGRLWVKVRLLPKHDDGEVVTKIKSAVQWLPFHDATGRPTVWFYSRD